MSKNDWEEGTMPGAAAPQLGPTWLKTAEPPPSSAPPAPRAISQPPPAAPPAFVHQPAPTFGQALSGGALLGNALDARIFGSTELANNRPVHASDAGKSGVTAASNAAASPLVRVETSVLAKPRAELAAPRDLFQVVWADAERIRAAGVERRPSKRNRGEARAWVSANGTGAADGKARDQRDPGRVLGQELSDDLSELGGLMSAAADASGEILPTYATLRGELVLVVDELERLAALASAIEPLAGLDKRVADAAAHAKDVVGRKITSRESIESATRRLLDGHAALSRSSQELEHAIDHSLLRARAFQKRSVLGGEQVRVVFSQGTRTIPVYLVEEAANALPLWHRFKVVIHAEVLPAQDETEPNPLCLRALAIGRLVTPPGAS